MQEDGDKYGYHPEAKAVEFRFEPSKKSEQYGFGVPAIHKYQIGTRLRRKGDGSEVFRVSAAKLLNGIEHYLLETTAEMTSGRPIWLSGFGLRSQFRPCDDQVGRERRTPILFRLNQLFSPS